MTPSPSFSNSSESSLEAAKLVQRFIRLRSKFKPVDPENIATLRKQIRDSSQTGKITGFNDAGLFYNAAEVISRYPEAISMGDLSHELEVPLSTATRTMDWLVNNGYAQRVSDPKDRRVVRVELTKQGKETYHAISTFLLERVEQALGSLAPDERKTFVKLLDKVLNAFEETA